MLPEIELDNPSIELSDPLDLRGVPRVAADLPASLYSTDMAGPIPCRVRDLSVTGACIATASPFALKSVQRVVVTLPRGSLALDAQGTWQRDAQADDVILSGLKFCDPPKESLDQLWELVFSIGQQLARFLLERTQLQELGVEEGLGLAQTSRFRDIPAGRIIYRQDTALAGEESIFVLVEGTVALQARVRDAFDVETHRLHPGDMFGGLPLIGAGPHAETAVAVVNSRLLEIDRQAYRFMRQTRPWLGFRVGQALLRTYAVRLRELSIRIHREL